MSQDNTNEAGAAFNDLYHKVPALVSRDHFDTIHSFLKRRIGKELESAQRIIGNMAADLGAIHDALGLHPDDAAGAPPILTAIAELKAQPGVDFRVAVQAMVAKMESGEWDEKSVEGIGGGDLLAEHLSTVITELHCELDDATDGPDCIVQPEGWKLAPPTLTDADIEKGWRKTFSTDNPYCPCNLKSFTKAVRWAERALAASMGGETS